MRVGIVPELNSFGGGIYQYSLTMLNTLAEWATDEGQAEFTAFVHKTDHPIIAFLRQTGWEIRPAYPPSTRRWMRDMARRIVGEEVIFQTWQTVRQWGRGKSTILEPADAIRFRPEMRRWFEQSGVKLMLYPAPIPLSFEAKIPFVLAIHDLQHRLRPEFPEFSANGEWEWREYLFRNAARYATLLLADSEVGREDILNFYEPYGITPDRIKVLPFLPAHYLTVNVSEDERQRIRATYKLPERYLFYPAQFWPHKNHTNIVQALDLLKRRNHLEIPIVFCGSYKGKIREYTFNQLMSLARQLKIKNQILYLGYVPDKNMSSLYGEAVALVMPTFCGPTNIPVVEAWAFSCPVLTSDVRGIREHSGDAAILVEPDSVEAIADGIYQLWSDADLCQSLIERGKQRLANYTYNDYRQRLVEILEEAKLRICSEKPKSIRIA